MKGVTRACVCTHSSRHPNEQMWNVAHQLLIFWVPATIILVCYMFITLWIWQNGRVENSRNTSSRSHLRNMGDTTILRTRRDCVDLRAATHILDVSYVHRCRPQIIVSNCDDTDMQHQELSPISREHSDNIHVPKTKGE
jgi:hypothetical protein